MPQRITKVWAVAQGFAADNWHYVISWFIITCQWAASMPEWVAKILVAVGTGFGLGVGKWLWAKLEKKLEL